MNSAAMYWERANKKVLGLVALSSLILLQTAATNYQILRQKAQQQQQALGELKRWKSEYEALLPIQKQWQDAIPSAKNIADIYSLYNAIGLDKYGLSSNPEKLTVKNGIEPLTAKGSPLGATRVCVSSAGETGLAVSAPHVSDLLTGLDALVRRRDINVANITLSVANGTPKAVLDLCLIFRN